MCVFECACIYARIFVCCGLCILVFISRVYCECACVYICMCVKICMHVCLGVYCVCVHVCVCACAHTHGYLICGG